VEVDETFAYDSFRPGQKALAQRVHDACVEGGTLVAEAMSGFGKTAAVLAGAISAAEETDSRVVYTCRTKRQILRVVEEISRIQGKYHVTAASMLTKFDYCLLKRQAPRTVPPESFGWYCGFNVSNNLCSYFLNVALAAGEFDEAVSGALATIPTQAQLLKDAESIHVCPYEVARVAMGQALIAVVPYPYVFDEKTIPLLFDRNSIERSRTILVVDEAHNLRDFLRGVNSASLSMDEVEGAIREAEALLMSEAAASLRVLAKTFQQEMESTRGWLADREQVLYRFRAEKGTTWLQNLAFELSACSEAAWGAVTYGRRLPSLVLKVGEFLSRLSSSNGTVLVKWERSFGLLVPNPVATLAQTLGLFRSSVLLSATVNPSDVFVRSLGMGNGEVSTYAVSAEPLVTVRTVIDIGVTTKYKSRTPDMYAKISDKIAATITSTKNGVGIFTPSYSILEAILEMVSKKVRGRNLVAEARGLSSEDAADRFDSFRSIRGSVLFAVQGGRFSEGEDFRDELMDTVIVVGLALPPPSPMLYAEYACLKRAGEPDSFLMLSRLPALRKAFQAAGRHIRGPGKKGLVLLLDDRFNTKVVRELMPPWLGKDVISGDFHPTQLREIISRFWANHS